MMRPGHLLAAGLCGLLALTGGAAGSADLYKPGEHRALTADLRAAAVGDLLTVLVYENSSATSSTDTSTDKTAGVRAEINSTATGRRQGGQMALGDDFAGKGRVQRSGRLTAQLSMRVLEIQSNGDFIVSGQQTIEINGEVNEIRISGRIRRADIGENNTVLSSRIADARIDYVGEGYISDRARPGLITKVLTWLGLW